LQLRLQVMLNPEELDEVDDFRFEERIRYRPLTTPKGSSKPMSTPSALRSRGFLGPARAL
jgi:hypothetical protein